MQVAGGVQMGHAAGGNGLRIGGRGLGTSDEPGGFPSDSVDFVQGVGRQLLDESVLGIRGHQQLLVAGGAVVIPASSYGALSGLMHYLPSGALGEAFRAATLHGEFAWWDLAGLLIWAVVGAFLTAKTFRWE